MSKPNTMSEEASIYFIITHAAVCKLMSKMTDNGRVNIDELEAFMKYQKEAIAGLESSINDLKSDS